MLIHGGLMEAATGILMLPLVLCLGVDGSIKQSTFAIDFFQENLVLMLAMGIIFGIIRVIGAIGVLKNRMWGFVLAIINCIVTMVVMIFMIPMGIIDGIFACTALAFLLTGYYGQKPISRNQE